MITDRDRRGRFIKGNSYAISGWRGLVNRRFAGDEAACKAWWGRIGAYYYDISNFASTPVSIKFSHPGTPEQFLAQRRRSLEFTLDDVQELEF